MKRVSLYCIGLMSTTAVLGYVINLPQDFCRALDIAQKKGCDSRTIEFTTKSPVFIVVIHGTFSNQDQFLDEINLNTEDIPVSFFTDPAYNETNPIRLSFGWSGKNEDSARIEGGKKLANGLNDMFNQCSQAGITPKIVLIAHSHGGNVIAVASNLVSKPIDTAILLATPVLRYDSKKKVNNETDLYLPKSITNLFLFYSMNDFVQTAGAALGSDFKRRYGPINGINLYNVRLLLDGQEPGHSGLYTQVIDDHILALCTKIKQLYKKNKNLIANIAPNNSKADKLIAIKKYDPATTNPLTGNSTDSLWTNWENFTYPTNEPDEAAVSTTMRERFKEVYGQEFTDTALLVDRSVRAIQQELCTRVVGKVGGGLSLLPEKTLKTAANFCCPFNEFKQMHPNATKALQCQNVSSVKNSSVLTDQENQDMCLNVFGVAGRSLALLPDAAKKDLKKRCDTQAFKTKHPKAAQAIGLA